MAPGRAEPLTIACQDRDFTEWHGGRTHALAWVLDVDDETSRRLVAAGRRRLGDMVLSRYRRQPHVTLTFVGLVDDDVRVRVATDVDALRDVCAGPVTMTATGWGTFPMVPHLVLECDWLVRANRLLTRGAPPDHLMDYVPHLTLGHYAGSWPQSAPLARLGDLAAAGSWTSDALGLVRFSTADIAGPLETVGRLDLTTGAWRSTPG